MIEEVIKGEQLIMADKMNEIIREINSINNNFEERVAEILKERIKITKVNGVPAIRIE